MVTHKMKLPILTAEEYEILLAVLTDTNITPTQEQKEALAKKIEDQTDWIPVKE